MKIIDKILKEIIEHPNEDMLIIKPNLFCYQPIENLEEGKENGIKHFDKKFLCFFQRIPDELKTDKNYLLKISIQKLKRIKDQDISITSRNIPNYENGQKLYDDDIKKLCQTTDLISRYLKKDYDLKDVPSCILYLSGGFLPKWTYKIIEDESAILEFRRLTDEKKVETLKKVLTVLRTKLNQEIDKHDNKITTKMKLIRSQMEKIEFKIRELESRVTV